MIRGAKVIQLRPLRAIRARRRFSRPMSDAAVWRARKAADTRFRRALADAIFHAIKEGMKPTSKLIEKTLERYL
jgi:hypothetical protein